MLSDIAEIIILGGQYREATFVAYNDTINVGIIVNARYLCRHNKSAELN
jgi:hypothetical protein